MNENDFCGIFHENGIETILSSVDICEFKDGILISFAIIFFKFLDWWYNWRFHVITLLTNLKSLVAFKHSESWKVENEHLLLHCSGSSKYYFFGKEKFDFFIS